MTISNVPSEKPLLPGRAVLRFFFFLSQFRETEKSFRLNPDNLSNC